MWSAAQLAPGGHLGRFIVWTKSAFERLDSVFGTSTEVGSSLGPSTEALRHRKWAPLARMIGWLL